MIKKYEKLDQYDNNPEEEISLKRRIDYAFYIWEFLINFSSLEHEIDIALADRISHGSHELWYHVTKILEVSDKINLLHDLMFQYLCYCDSKEKIWLLDKLIERLKSVTVLRNKVAHWKWNTLDCNGYLRVDVKVSKEDGWIIFRKFKITLPILRKGIKEIEKLIEEIPNFLSSL